MSKEPKEIVVYNKAIAYELRLQGFKIIRVGVNPHYPQFDCYYFQSTPEFHFALANLISKRKEAKEND